MSDNTNKGELFMKIKKLAQENEALRAQVEQLRNEFENQEADADPYGKIAQILAATPAQCLAEIRAQAGRNGFIACIRLAYELKHPPGTIHADYYANQLRQAAKEQQNEN